MHRVKKYQKFLKVLWFAALFSFCMFLRLQVYSLAYVPSESMMPTLQKGDCLFATRYDKTNIQRYDVVLFDYPDNEHLCFVKRVIGMPGDTIEIKKGKVYANGVLLKDNFTAELSNDEGIFQVPEGCFFMLGDNRNHSHDSRFWENTFVRQDQIRGRVKCILFPFSRAGTV